jgi:hypothetical protein
VFNRWGRVGQQATVTEGRARQGPSMLQACWQQMCIV